MKEDFLASYRPHILSVFRIVTGLLFFQYGVAVFLKFPVVAAFANITPLTATTGTFELVGGALLMLGLFTRPTAFFLSGFCAFAFFIGHVFKTTPPVFLPLLNNGTLPILFCFACLYLAAAGPGPWSLDALVKKRA